MGPEEFAVGLTSDPHVTRKIRGNKGRASRTKGRKGELEVQRQLEAAFGRVVSLNYNQSRDGGDDITLPLAVPLHGVKRLRIEIKRRATGAYGSILREALDQVAKVTGKDDLPLVFVRNDNEPWRVLLDARFLVTLLAEYELYRSVS